jgi:hypothetical protein
MTPQKRLLRKLVDTALRGGPRAAPGAAWRARRGSCSAADESSLPFFSLNTDVRQSTRVLLSLHCFMSSLAGAQVLPESRAVFCSGTRSPCILDAMNRFGHRCSPGPPVLFCQDDTDTSPTGSALATFAAVPLSRLAECLNTVDSVGVKLIIVDDDPASSVALMSVLLALRNRNTTRRLTVLVVSRLAEYEDVLPSHRMMQGVMRAAYSQNDRATVDQGFALFVTNERPASVVWCDAVCDCRCSAGEPMAERGVRDADLDACLYYACATGSAFEVDYWGASADFNDGFNSCDRSAYFRLRTIHHLLHRQRTSGPDAAPSARVASALDETVPSAEFPRPVTRPLLRLDLFRSVKDDGNLSSLPLQLLDKSGSCDTVLRALYDRRHGQASCADGRVGRVEGVIAADHTDYFRACHTVFCCGSRVRPVADVMRRHAVSLHADDSGALPSRVLLYDGNPPQRLLPAARLMSRFEWYGDDGRPALPVLGVVLSHPDLDALHCFMAVTTLVVAADADNSSAPALFHAMFCLWRHNPQRQLTVRVVRPRTESASATALETAVRAHTTAPNYGMSLGWLPSGVRSHREVLKDFFQRMTGMVTWRDECLDAVPEERPADEEDEEEDAGDAAARLDRRCQTLVDDCLDLVRRVVVAYYLVKAAVEPIRDAFLRDLRAIRCGDADTDDPSDPPAPAPIPLKRPRIE